MIPRLVCDFDGTLALHDVGDAICERFADPAWVDACEAWREGKLTLPQAQDRMWSLVRASREDLLAYVDAIGELRDGADALFEAVRANELELVVASGGFDLYIEHILGARLQSITLYCNHLEPSARGASIEFHQSELSSDSYAVDKAMVLARHPGAFAGDGGSDASVLDTDAPLFVVRDSTLHRLCNDARRSCVPFTDFREILAMLSAT